MILSTLNLQDSLTEISQELEVETRRIDQSWFNHQLLLFGGIRATIAHPSFRHAVIRNGHAAKKRKGLPCSQCKNAVHARCDHYVQVPHQCLFSLFKEARPSRMSRFPEPRKEFKPWKLWDNKSSYNIQQPTPEAHPNIHPNTRILSCFAEDFAFRNWKTSNTLHRPLVQDLLLTKPVPVQSVRYPLW